jgi:DNA-binding response OmpR family regulator
MPKKILVAEDEADIREEVAAVLEGAGYAVETASTSVQAIEMLRVNSFDLVLTDYHMTDGTARDVLACVEQKRPGLPVVVMSGSVVSGGMGLLAGARALVPKPFNSEGLIGTVETVLREPRRRHPLDASP